MLVLNSPQVVQETVLRWKREDRIALVPTMGALHEGHLRLVRKARELGGRTVVSLFVNPLQFGPNEDFSRYPRTLEQDLAHLKEMDVDLVFTPEPADLYPPGFVTRISLPSLSRHLCGASRPGHFDGVATVVLKLFNITQADLAVFGEKDFQQLRLLQQMTADLNLPVSIVPHPTVREEDGLALSSRNRYLTPDERRAAAALPRALRRAAETALEAGETPCGQLTGAARREVEQAGFRVDYLAVCSERDLVPAADATAVAAVPQPRIFAAAFLGNTRLIDNAPLYPEAHETTP